ncbi:DJ-1/PfpI family protein [Sporichthya polymorpha]|uniref:DJ-1/PfpI family protein n=1 Tax=Sporichthya polymorpha TaxID=35751 RepID=UPI00036361BF|nr:DJ-1/PfpI family protein [Sporichthya polymorpha]
MTRIGVYIWPRMTMLDVFGPHQFLGLVPGWELVTVARTTDPVVTDTGVRVLPDHDLTSCPELDILLVGGGADPSPQLRDPDVIAWVAKKGAEVQWVTSVCNGALILAEAGLLDGYRATTHWGNLPDLATYSEVEVVTDQRVVRDRNRITAGGVTSGIDFGLTLISEIAGPDVAAALQLVCEYDPHPPTPYGHPRNSPPELLSAVGEMLGPLRTDLDAFYAAKASA